MVVQKYADAYTKKTDAGQLWDNLVSSTLNSDENFFSFFIF
jgi:hypothetical protein